MKKNHNLRFHDQKNIGFNCYFFQQILCIVDVILNYTFHIINFKKYIQFVHNQTINTFKLQYFFTN